MVKGVLFSKSGTRSLLLRPAVGGPSSFIKTEFPDARIIGRRSFGVNADGNLFQFVEPAETVDLLYAEQNTEFDWGVFYNAGVPVINDTDGNPDPIYTPTNLHGTNVTFSSPSGLLGDVTFKYSVDADETFKIVANGLSTEVSNSEFPITFQIPYFLLRNRGPGMDGKRYITILSITVMATIAEIPNSFPDSFVFPSSDPQWTSNNTSMNGSLVMGDGSGSAYDAIRYYSLPERNSVVKGYYAAISFFAYGSQYAGLTTSLTSTDPVEQYQSKIDAGFKNDNGTVYLVVNGAETTPIGDYTSMYCVLYDGRSYFYYKDYERVLVRSRIDVTSTMNVGVAIYNGNVGIVGGTYTGEQIEVIEKPTITNVSQSPDEINVVWTCDGTYTSYTLKLINDQGTVEYSFPNTSVITPDMITNFADNYVNYTFVIDAEYLNTVQSSDPYAFTLADPRPLDGVSNIQASADVAGELTISWSYVATSGHSNPKDFRIIIFTPNASLDVVVDNMQTSYTWSIGHETTVGNISIITNGWANQLDTQTLSGSWNVIAPPPPIVAPSITDIKQYLGKTTVVISSNGGSPDNYDIRFYDPVTSNLVTTFSAVTLTDEKYDITTGLDPGAYNVQVVANYSSSSGLSDVIQFTQYRTDKPVITSATQGKNVDSMRIYYVCFMPNIVSYNFYLTKSGITTTYTSSDMLAESYTVTSLEGGTYDVQMEAVDDQGIQTASDVYGNVVIQGGGGGGGGGGNNGGNGHNMAELEYNYPDWEASVDQTNTITVLGEDSGALTVDETIVVNVPLSKLQECVVYDSNWTPLTGEEVGEQPLPKVAFRPSESYAAKSELDAMFAKLKDKGTGTVSARTFNDDAAASHDNFGKILITDVSFSGSVLESEDLPKVAIRSIAEGDIAVEELTTTVASVTTSSTAHKAYLEGLFEQLVAADRIKLSDGAATDASWGPAKKPSLLAGDSLSFKIKYNFTKTREYEVDGLDAGNGNTEPKALTLTIGGSTFTIQVGADGSETSEPFSRTYAIKMVATA